MKIIVSGINGRMGGEIARTILQQPALQLLGAIGHGDEIDGADIGSIIGGDAIGVKATQLNQADVSKADAIIDFTLPVALPALLEKAVESNVALVTGTTGLSDELQSKVHDAAKTIPLLQSFNMSMGVNLLAGLVEQASARLGEEFDIEINEVHHRHKKDAPSGTALLLGVAAAKGRGVNLGDVSAIDRNHERNVGDIGFSVQRGGGVIGDHSVMLIGENDRIELTHKAQNRSIYVDGAIKACLLYTSPSPRDRG